MWYAPPVQLNALERSLDVIRPRAGDVPPAPSYAKSLRRGAFLRRPHHTYVGDKWSSVTGRSAAPPWLDHGQMFGALTAGEHGPTFVQEECTLTLVSGSTRSDRDLPMSCDTRYEVGTQDSGGMMVAHAACLSRSWYP